MQKKKILHFITGLEVGGAEMMLLKTLPKMQNDFDNRVCCIIGHGPMGKKLEEAGVPVFYLDLKNIFNLGFISRFRKIIKDFQPDILITYLIHADLLGRVFGRVFGIKKIICSVRVKLVQAKYLPLLFLDAVTSPLVTHYHFNSQTVADMYQKFFFLPQRKITVIPNGLKFEEYALNIDKKSKKKTLEIPLEKIIIGCVGRLEKQKGHKYLLQAFSQALKKQPKLFLIIIGTGSDKEKLEELTNNLSIQDNVKFLGRRTDVAEILQVIDIFVLPSLFEGMSNSLMEAMASGLPIIATNIAENGELIENGKTGILVPPKDSNALAKALVGLTSNIEKQKLLRENAKQFARVKFDLEIIAEKLKDFLVTV